MGKKTSKVMEKMHKKNRKMNPYEQISRGFPSVTNEWPFQNHLPTTTIKPQSSPPKT